jgi:hypothetical protein
MVVADKKTRQWCGGNAARRDAGASAGGKDGDNTRYRGVPVGNEIAALGEYQSASGRSDYKIL